ncbi:hypothetical protein [Saccharothrix texasensis]|uniref:hypothetical protein n=1 Tax=Saccharothrix texasensis TaxID=103734 RepID=UPI0011CD8AE8|nr:hypothetical protein [Saccharothrix texasensis]
MGVALVSAAAGVVAPAYAAPTVQTTVVSRTSAATPVDKEVVVSCPPGTKVYSAGGRVSDWSKYVELEAVTPLPDLAGVRVVATTSATVPPWTATAYAVCGPGNPSLATPAVASLNNPLVSKLSEAVCASGTAVGAGAELSGDIAQAGIEGVMPQQDKGRAWASGDPLAQWEVTASAVCLQWPGQVQLAENKVFVPGTIATATAECPVGGGTLLGGGAVTGFAPNVVTRLVELKLEQGKVTGVGVRIEGASPWAVSVSALCGTS